MSESVPDLAAAATRLGQLQRGRGAGFARALAAGRAAHDDVLQCIVEDPRVDSQIEDRARYYAELVQDLAMPIEGIAASLRGQPPQLGHEVLAGAFRLGHAGARTLLADVATDEAVVHGMVESLWGRQWARLVDMPARAAPLFLRLALGEAQCARPSRRLASRALPDETSLSVEQLLDLGREVQHEQRKTLVAELCRRSSEAEREVMANCAEYDIVYGRVRLAARVLGMLADERLLPLAEHYFAREDVFEDAARRLSGHERMRRSALAGYVRHLPEPRQLALARDWHARGGYFETVAGTLLAEQASPDDRGSLEEFVAARSSADSGWGMLSELDALARLADPRSAPLLAEVAERAAYSHARRRALAGLANMPHLPVAAAALREALWDCEDEAAADACAFVPRLDAGATGRVRALADHALADVELQQRAARRLRRLG